MGQHLDPEMNGPAKMNLDLVSLRLPAAPDTAPSSLLRRNGDAL
jgi:hypothetical protein